MLVGTVRNGQNETMEPSFQAMSKIIQEIPVKYQDRYYRRHKHSDETFLRQISP